MSYWCEHPEQRLCWYPDSLGRPQLRNQCLRCGEPVGRSYPQKDAPPDTPQMDPTIKERYAAELEALDHESRETARDIENGARRSQYDE